MGAWLVQMRVGGVTGEHIQTGASGERQSVWHDAVCLSVVCRPADFGELCRFNHIQSEPN